MSWVKIDDQMGYHAKTVAAGNAAFGAWVRMLTWTCAQLTDGYLPYEIAKGFASQSEIKTLLKVVLLDQVEGGYTIHDFLEWNPTAASIKEKRESDRSRKGMGRQNQGRDARGRVTSERNPAGRPSGIRAESERNPSGVRADSIDPSTGPTPTPTPTPTPIPTLTLPGGGDGPSVRGEREQAPEPPKPKLPASAQPHIAELIANLRSDMAARGGGRVQVPTPAQPAPPNQPPATGSDK